MTAASTIIRRSNKKKSEWGDAMKIEWAPLEEMDNDDGAHTAYFALNVADKTDIVIEQVSDGTWDVMRLVHRLTGMCSSPMVNCKTLTSAKRWVSRYMT